ncbi:protein LSM14 homolog B-like isoform X2 [Eriocheir sinensis]|uniref:protein LSM14 homolog B-like isoform X2 n=1 Tax=Eriocheir sinensis TaxID=95602 RepID=UPI0021C7298C|nr:protein LSM14 homolog B-like isoform X2 [Eriocheir sinensis]
MSGPIPFLGSKISLISKSEIRYEGILYTIDAQESIIALAKVRSFGTEDRPTEMPVPAREEVYEYIIFRGTDIKKIEVCDTPKQPTLPGGLHNDPAIVQHSAPAVPSSFQAAPFSRQSLGPIGGSLGLSYGSYGQSITQQGIPGAGGFPMGTTSQPSELSTVGTSGGSGVGNLDQPSGSAPVAVQAPIGPPPQSGAHALHQTDILVGSRSSTPTARKSPVSDAGVQVSPPPNREEKKKPQQRQPQQERVQRNGSQPVQVRRGNPPQAHQQQQQQQQHHQQQHHQHQHMGPQQGQQQHHQPSMQQGQQHQQHHSQHHYNNQYYQYQQYQGRGGGMNRGRGTRRPTGQRGRGQSFNQGNRQRQFQDRQLFEKDYDFEQANEEFEELRNQLAKTKITENGDKKDDSGHETAGETVEEDPNTCYDKTKSFFDSISCEAIERSKGKSQRPDWRLERKINVETFGVSSARRGYYPRGRGGYYRGGYYRTYNNYNHGYYRGGGSGGYRGGRGGGGMGSSSGGRGMAVGGGAPGAVGVAPAAAPAAAAAVAAGAPAPSAPVVAGLNGVSQRGGGGAGSYSATVRNSTPTK